MVNLLKLVGFVVVHEILIDAVFVFGFCFSLFLLNFSCFLLADILHSRLLPCGLYNSISHLASNDHIHPSHQQEPR